MIVRSDHAAGREVHLAMAMGLGLVPQAVSRLI